MLWWRNVWIAAALTLPPALAAATHDLIQVTGVRSWTHPDSTRVIVEASGRFEYRTDPAFGPPRFFIDIFHARPLIANRRSFLHEIIGDKLIQRVRVAETAP